ncbi:MAG TPA: ATP-binding cassette domain-containing protein [Terriglobales bacterium]|jgi:phospholipid/cholesterol/gamma-HCH transport system ATP-binding protein|nr:ATP-binding cassette domain-containing protein [Terriglobales bacterium]
MPAPVLPAESSARLTDAQPQPVIVFEDVAISFEGSPVLDGISFSLERGETKALLGVAGSGKSTILKLTMGLLQPDRGNIWVLGQEVSAMKEEDLFELRRRIGMVFQESALFDSLTVRDNVAYRLIEEDVPEDKVQKRVEEALRFVELEHTLNMLPSELSGGMRRRVAIARAIVDQPEIVLYDSPTGGLDPVTSTTIIELIVKQRDVYHNSSLLVSHRLQDAFTMATHYFDRNQNRMVPVNGAHIDTRTSFLVLRDGKVIFDGSAHDLATNRDEYIREYIS